MLSKTQLVVSWIIARSRLRIAKHQENELRTEIASRFFPNPNKGVNYDSDVLLKLVHKENYSLTSDRDAVVGMLASLSEAFPALRNIGELVVWKPSVVVSEYEALPDDAKAMFNHILTIKNAMPTLALAKEKDAE